MVFETGFFLLLSDGVGVVVVSCKVVARLILFLIYGLLCFFVAVALGSPPVSNPHLK